MDDRKHIGESEPKAKVEPCARSLSEISEREPRAKRKLSEDSFI